MSNFVYSKASGQNDPMIGKFEHPIKMLIENESNHLEKEKTILDALYNVEKSTGYSETFMGESDFGTFQMKGEMQRAENDSIEPTYKKTIGHISFGKEFTISKEMADDAKIGIATRSKAANFVRAYYRTRVEIAAKALINGTNGSMVYNKAPVDLTVGDGLPLFSNAHTYSTSAMNGKTQTNYFYGDIGDEWETTLGIGANRIRNFKDENGNTMGYTADTVIIPCNRPLLEMKIKQICGSERSTGSGNNDINTQYGNWTMVVLDNWETTDDRIMVMSSVANKNLMGNVFLNRKPLDIRYGIDDHTRDMYWNGYCRFGVGFTTWKHMALIVNSASAVSGATSL